MQISSFKPLTRSEHPEAPEWMDGVFKKLNAVLREFTIAMQAQLSLADNVNAEVRQLQVRDGVPLEVELQTLRGRPIGASLLYWDRPENAKPVRMTVLDVKKVRLTVDFDTDPGLAVNVTIVIWGS